MKVIGVALILLAVATAIVMARRRTVRHDSGITGFRKHIDALSPESRREVQDRVRDQHAREAARERELGDDGQGPASGELL